MRIRKAELGVALVFLTLALNTLVAGPGPVPGEGLFERDGTSRDPSFFPIAVWLQSPRLAPRYQAAGINLYVGLWKGPSEAHLAELTRHTMPVICSQNEVGLTSKNRGIIAGWMHGDEPDNAQSLGNGQGYGPPIEPAKIQADYRTIRSRDPTRPVLLNLGQGVAWDGWHGRGVRTNHPEDYPQYVKGGDIVSFDIYPVAHSREEVQGKLWYVARGVERLRGWCGPRKTVWNCIECTRIHSQRKATPRQVRAEVWMSIIHGSRGLIYFVHEWQPRFNEHALLDDAQMLEAVAAINAQIHELAPVLNAPEAKRDVRVTSSRPEVPVAVLFKQHRGKRYVFAVSLREGETQVTFTVPGQAREAAIEVLGEDRNLQLEEGRFRDSFSSYAVHLYQVK